MAKKRPEKKIPHIVCSEGALLPTKTGVWKAIAFRDDADAADGSTHLALILGEPAGAAKLPVRVHSECLTGEVFGSLRCDCREQLHLAMRRIKTLGRGVIIYLRQEGRGIGIFNKIRAYHLQDHGHDTVEANRLLGLPIDDRDYSVASAFLKHLKVRSIRLLTNNPEKIAALKRDGVKVVSRLPHRTRPNRFDRDYLRTKRLKMRHDL